MSSLETNGVREQKHTVFHPDFWFPKGQGDRQLTIDRLFIRPPNGNGGTYDIENNRHVYPVPRVSPLDNGPVYPISEKDLVRIEKQVQTVANLVNYDAGNIAALIAKDLSSSAAEHELALLPQEDYFYACYGQNVGEECKEMIRNKINRYRIQYANELAVKAEVDILVTWDCPQVTTYEHIRWVPEDERYIVENAHSKHYKYPNWDLMYAAEKEETNNRYDRPQPGEICLPKRADSDGPPPSPEGKGGFYACVPLSLYRKLTKVSAAWGITTQIAVPPEFMSVEQEQEMADYLTAREWEVLATVTQKKEAGKEVKCVEEDEWKKRRMPYGEVLRAEHERCLPISARLQLEFF